MCNAELHDLDATLRGAPAEYYGGDIMLTLNITREMDVSAASRQAENELEYLAEWDEDLTPEWQEDFSKAIAELLKAELAEVQLDLTGARDKEYPLYIGLSS